MIKHHLKFSAALLITAVAALFLFRGHYGAAAISFLIFCNIFFYLFFTAPYQRFAEYVRRMAQGQGRAMPVVTDEDIFTPLSHHLRKVAVRNLAEKESQQTYGERLEVVLSSMLDGIIVLDSKATVMVINPSACKMFLVSREVIGKKLFEFVSNVALQDALDAIFKKGEHQVLKEVVLQTPNEKVLRLSANAIMRSDALHGAVLVFHDFTELKKLEELRREFVANVSHELKTPVASIKGYAETLLDGALQDKKHAQDFTQTIYDDADRLSHLIDNLLDLARLESGRMAMSACPCTISSLVSRAVDIVRVVAQGKNITLNVDCPNKAVAICDRELVIQALLNLLDNAVKYTPAQGTVKVRVHEEEDFWAVDVEDNGIGIAQDDLVRVFERFYRVDKARTRDLGGTGLGLSIVKHIINAHNGNVSAVSSPGKGSIFTLTLPKSL